MADVNVTMHLKAIDEASKNLANVGKSVKGLSGKFDGLKRAGEMAAGMLMRDMVNGITNTISKSFELGGKLGTLEKSFNRLVEAAGDTELSLERLRKATKGTVSDVDLLQSANQALLLGLPTEGLDSLMESAMTLGHAMGISTTKAVESLTTGLGRQSKLILDNLGVVFQASDAYKWYAKKIGAAGDSTEKMGRIAKKAAKKLGLTELSTEKLTESVDQLGYYAYLAGEVDLATLNEVLGEYSIELSESEARTFDLSDAINEGIIPASDMKDIYTRLGESIGGFSGELTEAQKKEAWQQYAIDQINQKAAELTGTMDESQLAHERWGATLSNVTGKIGQFLSPLSGIAPILTGLMPMIGTMAGTMLPSLASSFMSLGPVVSAQSAIMSTSITGLLGPIGLVVAAGAALYLAWTNDWGGIRTFVTETAIPAVQGAIGGFCSWLGAAWNTVTSKARSVWETAWTSIQNFISDPIGSIQGAVASFGGWVSSKFNEFTSQVFDTNSELWQRMETVWGPEGTEVLKNITTAFHHFISGDWGALGQDLVNVATSFTGLLKSLFGKFKDAIINIFAGLGKGILNKIKGALGSVKDAITGFVGGAKDALGGFANWLTGGSIWLDMCDEMESSWRDTMNTLPKDLNKGVHEVSRGLKRFAPLSVSAVAPARTPSTVVRAALPASSPSVVNVHITVQGTQEELADYVRGKLVDELKDTLVQATSSGAAAKRKKIMLPRTFRSV